jgi:hypothetical protein
MDARKPIVEQTVPKIAYNISFNPECSYFVAATNVGWGGTLAPYP